MGELQKNTNIWYLIKKVKLNTSLPKCDQGKCKGYSFDSNCFFVKKIMLVWLFNGFYLSTVIEAHHSYWWRNGFISGTYGSEIKKTRNDINSRVTIEYNWIMLGPLWTNIWKSESLPQKMFQQVFTQEQRMTCFPWSRIICDYMRRILRGFLFGFIISVPHRLNSAWKPEIKA